MMPRARRRIAGGLLALVLLVASAAEAAPATLTGRVLRVEDGMHLVMVDRGGAQYRIALEGIRTPGLREPFGPAARNLLVRRAVGRFAVFSWDPRDAGAPRRGTLRVANRDLAEELLYGGLAWVDPNRIHRLDPGQRRRYEQAEREAKARRRGIWEKEASRPAGSAPPAAGKGLKY